MNAAEVCPNSLLTFYLNKIVKLAKTLNDIFSLLEPGSYFMQLWRSSRSVKLIYDIQASGQSAAEHEPGVRMAVHLLFTVKTLAEIGLFI